jgi:hypothetical protein
MYRVHVGVGAPRLRQHGGGSQFASKTKAQVSAKGATRDNASTSYEAKCRGGTLHEGDIRAMYHDTKSNPFRYFTLPGAVEDQVPPKRLSRLWLVFERGRRLIIVSVLAIIKTRYRKTVSRTNAIKAFRNDRVTLFLNMYVVFGREADVFSHRAFLLETSQRLNMCIDVWINRPSNTVPRSIKYGCCCWASIMISPPPP